MDKVEIIPKRGLKLGKLKNLKIFHNKKLLIIIIAAIVILFVGSYLIARCGVITGDGECLMDSSCVMQQVTCCSCEMGGEEICMSRANATYWARRLADKCGDYTICPAVYNCKNVSCGCINGTCMVE